MTRCNPLEGHVSYGSRITTSMGSDRPLTFAGLRIDVVILACAISAGIHGALIPDHFQEGTGAGIGFVVATVLLAAVAIFLTHYPSRSAVVGATTIFIGLIVAYALVITAGVPLLHPGVEATDGLALFTKAVEAVGLLTAASLLRRPSFISHTQTKGTLT
jgi:hypothetical protein